MRGPLWTHKQQILDVETREYQAARKVQRPLRGWLREVRKTMGFTAAAMAEDLEISPSMVFQLERSERKETITLKRLKDVARSMECELVYCIVPRQGKFVDQLMAYAKQVARESRRRRR